MSEELDVLKLVAGRLTGAGIAYMISGSMAMNHYAQPRMTRDIDIVVELTPADASRITELFAGDCYCDEEAIRDALLHQSMFNVIHLDSVIKIDFIVRKDSDYRRTEFARRRQVTVEGAPLWMVTAEDLLLSKLHWAKESRSPMQLGDARNLVACVENLDWEYLQRWAADLTVTALLEDVRE